MKATKQEHLSLALGDWMKEEKEKQEAHKEDPTRLSIDAVKAARPATLQANSGKKGPAGAGGRGQRGGAGSRLPSWESPCHP